QLVLLLVRHRGIEQIAGVIHASFVVADRPLLVVALGFPVVVQHLGELGVVAGPRPPPRPGLAALRRPSARRGRALPARGRRARGADRVPGSSKLITGQPKRRRRPWRQPVPEADSPGSASPRPPRRRRPRRVPPSRRSGPAPAPPWRR